MSAFADTFWSIRNSLSGLVVAAAVGIHPAQAQEMTAGLIKEKMPAGERATYIMGIVEGLAYARFRKDTTAKGTKDSSGSQCIYEWFYKDSAKAFERIEAAFTKYPEQYPSTLLAVMIKKECGE